MDQIRVLLGPMPQMLREILEETFARQPDMAVVGPGAAGPLREVVDRYAPDVVVVGREGRDWVGRHVDLFRHRPRLRLLVIRNDGSTAALHELRIRRCPVPDLSPDAVVAAVRQSWGLQRCGGDDPPPRKRR